MTRLRPDAKALLSAYTTFYGCGGAADSEPCTEPCCPTCWISPSQLATTRLECSRYKNGASREASSGLGRWRGGDARTAAAAGPPDAWALGQGAGEDVEIHTTAESPGGYQEDARDLTIGRIIYFFDHVGNKRDDGGTQPPPTSWVLVHDYVSRGRGSRRDSDACTKHPVLFLRGRGRPLIYPVSAIKRHVHMYHLCPVVPEGGDTTWVCGLAVEKNERGGVAEVWQHKYKLASPGAGPGNDAYLLNEHHHSINKDSFV